MQEGINIAILSEFIEIAETQHLVFVKVLVYLKYSQCPPRLVPPLKFFQNILVRPPSFPFLHPSTFENFVFPPFYCSPHQNCRKFFPQSLLNFFTFVALLAY